MSRESIDEVMGWYGMGAILLAYALVSFGFLSASSVIYQFLNLTGAGGVAYISLKKKAYQPGALNIVWAVIALIAIIQVMI